MNAPSKSSRIPVPKRINSNRSLADIPCRDGALSSTETRASCVGNSAHSETVVIQFLAEESTKIPESIVVTRTELEAIPYFKVLMSSAFADARSSTLHLPEKVVNRDTFQSILAFINGSRIQQILSESQPSAAKAKPGSQGRNSNVYSQVATSHPSPPWLDVHIPVLQRLFVAADFLSFDSLCNAIESDVLLLCQHLEDCKSSSCPYINLVSRIFSLSTQKELSDRCKRVLCKPIHIASTISCPAYVRMHSELRNQLLLEAIQKVNPLNAVDTMLRLFLENRRVNSLNQIHRTVVLESRLRLEESAFGTIQQNISTIADPGSFLMSYVQQRHWIYPEFLNLFFDRLLELLDESHAVGALISAEALCNARTAILSTVSSEGDTTQVYDAIASSDDTLCCIQQFLGRVEVFIVKRWLDLAQRGRLSPLRKHPDLEQRIASGKYTGCSFEILLVLADALRSGWDFLGRVAA